MKSLIRKFVKRLFFENGYEVFRRHYYDFNADDSIKKILKLARIDGGSAVILDVGANVGQSVDRFRKYMPDAKVFSFEPNPDTFERLQKKLERDTKLKCFNVGVGSEKSTLPFFVNPDSGSNSFYKLNLDGDAFALSHSHEAIKNHNTTTLKQSVEYNTEISIPVDTLDNICHSEGITSVDVLKIDTQGFEFEVLRGARNMLPHTLIVEAEVMLSDSYEKASTLSEIQNLLSEFGFVLWEIPYIGKFATDKINRINFIDVHFVNLPLLRQMERQ